MKTTSKIFRISILLISLIFVFTLSSKSQGISFSAKLDSTKILIGDQVKVTLTVKHSGKCKVFFPDLRDTLCKGVEIVENLGSDTIKAEGGYLVVHQKYIITSFDSGQYVIPRFRVNFQENGKTDSAATNELFLEVFTVPIDTTKQAICDIKNQLETPFTFKEFIERFYPLIIAIFVLALIAFGVWYYFKKFRKKQPLLVKSSKPKEPPHIVALRELDRIKNEKLWQKNMIKEFHSQITEVIRIYIEGRFNIMAMEKTTDEIIASFSRTVLVSDSCLEALKQMLTLADFVKFAKAEPLPDENNSSLKSAYYFIDNTLIGISRAENNEITESNPEVK